MNKYLSSFFIFLLLLAAIIFSISLKLDAEATKLSWLIYFYFAVITLLFHYGVVRSTKSRPQVFIRYYMAATTIKLFLHLSIIIIFSFLHREMATRFIITFMIMYLLFTVFEVMAVWLKIRK